MIFALFLFPLNNKIGNKSSIFGYQSTVAYAQQWESPAFNFIYRLLIPVVYITLIAIPLSILSFGNTISELYYVALYYFIFRFILLFLLGRQKLVKWKYEIIISVISFLLCIKVNQSFISNNKDFIPSIQGMSDQIWFIIILFMYKYINDINIPSYKSLNYNRNKFYRIKEKYGSIIANIDNSAIKQAIVYAVIINEDFNRPFIIRSIVEKIGFKLGKVKTTGIMQVYSSEYLSDEKSIVLGANILCKAFDEIIKQKIETQNRENRKRKLKRQLPIHHKYNTPSDCYSEIMKTLDNYNKSNTNSELYEIICNIYKELT